MPDKKQERIKAYNQPFNIADFTFRAEPYLSGQAIEFMESIVTPDFRVLEFGSGGSTLWFAERVKSVLSFEHKEKWHKLLIQELQRKDIKNVTLNLDNYYAQNILGIQDTFDLILVDGYRVGRPNCIIEGSKLLNKGGYMIVDDVRYNAKYIHTLRPAMKYLDNLGWKQTDFTIGKKASAWQRTR